MISRRQLSLGTAAAAALARPAVAQAWPSRAVTLVVPWAAGGGADTVSRIFAQGLERELGQPVNVVNRTGGNGVVGHVTIANAAPDGYTIGIGTSEFVNYRVLSQSEVGPASYDLISRVAVLPAGVTVKGDGPWRTFGDLAKALAEGRRGQFTGSGVSTGGSWHLAAAGMTRAMGLGADRIRWVPSQGGAPALQDLVAGGIGIFTGSPIEARAFAEAGQARILAVMTAERMAAFPAVPTLMESGVDWRFVNWFSLVAPRNIPPPVRARLVEAAARAHARAEVQELLRARGIVPVWEEPEAFAAFVAEQADTSATLLRELGLVRA